MSYTICTVNRRNEQTVRSTTGTPGKADALAYAAHTVRHMADRVGVRVTDGAETWVGTVGLLDVLEDYDLELWETASQVDYGCHDVAS